MPSRMKLRATKFRTPSHCVVRFFAAIRLSNENVPGSDFTSQYRRSPGARGVNTAAHAPPSCFVAGFLAAAFFVAAFFAAGGLAVPVDFLAAVRLPLPDALI